LTIRSERSVDERWITVDGRRWRGTDPGIAEPFRKELVDELMSARRAVGAAKRLGDPDAEALARGRVNDAKVALGERGAPWWEPAAADDQRNRLEAVVMTLSRHRSPDRTICPSDAARAVGREGWRALLDPVRDVVRNLGQRGEVEVLQKRQVISLDQPWRGPIRVRATSREPAT
jgi:hypothetical protein